MKEVTKTNLDQRLNLYRPFHKTDDGDVSHSPETYFKPDEVIPVIKELVSEIVELRGRLVHYLCDAKRYRKLYRDLKSK